MTPEQFIYVQHIFLQARELGEQPRAELLARQDTSVALEVRTLLDADERCRGFLESKAIPGETGLTGIRAPDQAIESSWPLAHETEAMQPIRNPPAEQTTDHLRRLPVSTSRLGVTVDRYRLVAKIGEGGFGTVYLAEQSEPIRRQVAVKLIKPGMDSQAMLTRFHAERQALAMMDHPSIARVLDAGVTADDTPYFVMELVHGLPIDVHCDQHGMLLEQRLELFQQLCSAVHHAHQRGVLHRDIKPSNVLVTQDETGSVVKVIDFGIAKALDASLHNESRVTEFGQLVGTLEYMSPEQAEMSPRDIDTRSDVYALGVVLYQLLTGVTPIARSELLQQGMFSVPHQMRRANPRIPSERIAELGTRHDSPISSSSPRGLVRLPHGDLDAITMKALAKDRQHRYDSALDLHRDIDRFLAGKPVEAHPPSAMYELGLFLKRHRLIATSITLVLISTILGTLGLIVGIGQARTARAAAETDRDRAVLARRQADASSRQLATNLYSQLIQAAWRGMNEQDYHRAELELEACLPGLRGWEWNFVRDALQQKPATEYRDSRQPAITVVEVCDNLDIAACVTIDGDVEVWQLRETTLLTTLHGDSQANCTRFANGGTRLLVGHRNGSLDTYDTHSWKLIESHQFHHGGIYDIVTTHSEKHFAVCTGGSWIGLFTTDSHEVVREWSLETRISSLGFDEDETLFGCGVDGRCYRFHREKPEESWLIATAGLHELAWLNPQTMAILASGNTLLVSTKDIEAAPKVVMQTSSAAMSLATAHDTIAVGCGDGSLTIASEDGSITSVANFGTAILDIAWLEQRNRYLLALSDGRMLSIDPTQLSRGRRLRNGQANVTTGLLLSKRGWAILGDDEGEVRVLDAENGTLLMSTHAHQQAIWSAAVDRHERILATIGEDQRLRCWELPSLKLLFTAPLSLGVRAVCVAPDGTWIAAAPPLGPETNQEGTIGIWNVATGNCDYQLVGHRNWVLQFAVTPDGAQLVSSGENRTTRVWDTLTWEQRQPIQPPDRAPAIRLGLTTNGSMLLLGHRDGWVTSWQLSDGAPTMSWPVYGDALSGLWVTPDDRVVISSRSDSRIRVLDLAKQNPVAEFDLGLGYIEDLQPSTSSDFFAVTTRQQSTATILFGHPTH